MIPEWVVTILQSYGLAGVVMAALALDNYQQRKAAKAVTESRLGESKVLVQTLEANTTAIRENAKVTEARNVVTEALADALAKQAGVFDVFLQKTEFYQSTIKDTLQTQSKVIDALAESNRVNTGILRDVRDYIERKEQ